MYLKPKVESKHSHARKVLSTCCTHTYLTEEVVLFIIVARCDVSRLTNQEQVCGQLTPVVAFFPVIQPPPVKVYKIVLYARSNRICECILVVDVLVCPPNVGFQFIYKLRERPFTFLHWLTEIGIVTHLWMCSDGERERERI